MRAANSGLAIEIFQHVYQSRNESTNSIPPRRERTSFRCRSLCSYRSRYAWEAGELVVNRTKCAGQSSNTCWSKKCMLLSNSLFQDVRSDNFARGSVLAVCIRDSTSSLTGNCTSVFLTPKIEDLASNLYYRNFWLALNTRRASKW